MLQQPRRFTKKPVTIEALQWTGYNATEMKEFTGGKSSWSIDGGRIVIHTLEGKMFAQRGDYIIKGVKGEVYPCREDIFLETYEEVGVEGPSLWRELAAVFNRFSMENECADTPDFILADYLVDTLTALSEAISRREAWYGREVR